MFEKGLTGSISQDHMTAAARVVAWHLFEARRFLDEFSLPQKTRDALELNSWIIDRCRRENLSQLPLNQIRQYGPNRIRNKQALDEAILELEGAGRVKMKKEGRKTIIELNPALI